MEQTEISQDTKKELLHKLKKLLAAKNHQPKDPEIFLEVYLDTMKDIPDIFLDRTIDHWIKQKWFPRTDELWDTAKDIARQWEREEYYPNKMSKQKARER